MKKLIALCMAALLMLFTAPQIAQAASENVTMKVTADKETMVAGDTVNFEVAIGTVESLGGLEFTLNIPEGLTIVDSSIAIPDGLATVLDSDGDIIKPASINGYKWSYSAQMTGYKGTSDLTILTFACTVDSNASGTKSVTLNMSCCFDNINLDEHNVTVVPASVTVGVAVPTAAPTAVPTEAPTAVPTEAPTAVPTEAPTAVPSEAPTAVPTEAPTAVPTEAPTAEPTEAPTEAPTAEPTEAPTAAPTQAPVQATSAPSQGTVTAPVATQAPTAAPTQVPAEVVSPKTGDGNTFVWLIGLLFVAGVVLYHKKNRA